MNSNLSPLAGNIVEDYFKTVRIGLHPVKVLFNICCINHQQVIRVVLRKLAIDYEVIHRAAVRPEHHSIYDTSVGQVCDIICKDMVHKTFRILAGNQDFAHMRHVEHPDSSPYCPMLVFD